MFTGIQDVIKGLRVPGWIRTLVTFLVLPYVTNVIVLLWIIASAGTSDWTIIPLARLLLGQTVLLLSLGALGMTIFEVRDAGFRRKNRVALEERQRRLKARNSRIGEL